jgi:hypothetical protein
MGRFEARAAGAKNALKDKGHQIRNAISLSLIIMSDESSTARPGESTPTLGFNKDTPDSQIWTIEEKRILKSHIDGYRAAPRKTKSSYVAAKVIPEIKKAWNGRYDKTKMKNDRALKKEWDKKKNVS